MLRPGYAIEYDAIDPTELDGPAGEVDLRGCLLQGKSTGPAVMKRRLARD